MSESCPTMKPMTLPTLLDGLLLRIPQPLRAEYLDFCWHQQLQQLPGSSTLLRLLIRTYGWRSSAGAYCRFSYCSCPHTQPTVGQNENRHLCAFMFQFLFLPSKICILPTHWMLRPIVTNTECLGLESRCGN